MRLYFKPTLYSNISDNHNWTIIRKKGNFWVGDSVKYIGLGFYKSIIPTPIAEDKACWIKG